MTAGVDREPLVRPPTLRTGQEASASRLELFFDLAYVLVVLELATTFLGDLMTWHGLGTFAALFIAVWLSWVGFTLGLFVILVLGEAVGGAATGVHDAKWAAPAVAVGFAGFVIAAALWWTYFDTTATGSAEKLQERDDRDSDPEGATADERHDLFVYGHLPLTFGIAMAGIGVEDLVLHPGAALPSPGGWTLAAGIALFLTGSALILGGTRHSWRAIWPWPTIAIPIVLAAAAVRHNNALLLVGGLALVCLALATLGTVRRRA